MSSFLVLIGQAFGYEADSTPVSASPRSSTSTDDDDNDDNSPDDALVTKITSIVAEAQTALDKCMAQPLTEKCSFRPDQLAKILLAFQNAMQERAFERTIADDQHSVITQLTTTAVTRYQFEAQELSRNYLKALNEKRNSANEFNITIIELEKLTSGAHTSNSKDLRLNANTLSSDALSKISTTFEVSKKFGQIGQEIDQFAQSLQVLKVILLTQLSHRDSVISANQSSEPFRNAMQTIKAIETELATKALGLKDLKKLEEEKS